MHDGVVREGFKIGTMSEIGYLTCSGPWARVRNEIKLVLSGSSPLAHQTSAALMRYVDEHFCHDDVDCAQTVAATGVVELLPS